MAFLKVVVTFQSYQYYDVKNNKKYCLIGRRLPRFKVARLEFWGIKHLLRWH